MRSKNRQRPKTELATAQNFKHFRTNLPNKKITKKKWNTEIKNSNNCTDELNSKSNNGRRRIKNYCKSENQILGEQNKLLHIVEILGSD